jgi:hypothetical protein
MLLQVRKKFITYIGWCTGHGYSNIKHKLLSFTEYLTFPILREILQLLFRDTCCPALGRA